jgi:hypothetical protein
MRGNNKHKKTKQITNNKKHTREAQALANVASEFELVGAWGIVDQFEKQGDQAFVFCFLLVLCCAWSVRGKRGQKRKEREGSIWINGLAGGEEHEGILSKKRGREKNSGESGIKR